MEVECDNVRFFSEFLIGLVLGFDDVSCEEDYIKGDSMGDWVGCFVVEVLDEEVVELGGCVLVLEVLFFFDVVVGEYYCVVGESDEGEGDGWEGGGGDESEDEG